MTTSDSFVRSDGEPLSVRLRHDIHWTKANEGLAIRWVASDPLTRRLFRCTDVEYHLLRWLEESPSLEALQTRFRNEFQPQQIELGEIRKLIGACAQSGMLRPKGTSSPSSSSFLIRKNSSEPMGSQPSNTLAPSIVTRRHGSRMLRVMSWIANRLRQLFLSQIPLGNPDRWLHRIAPATGWLYSPTAFRCWTFSFVAALVLLAFRWDTLWLELPTFQELRSPKALIGFGFVFLGTRMLHELGHAITCKREGVGCHEWGVLLMFGMACPYVDITDAWKLGNRYQRMWVAFAGMYTELALATVASLIWMITYPGGLHRTSLQIMLVSSMTTLLFNANPWMKYDGYFILCDWCNVPYLRERAAATFHRWFDGGDDPAGQGTSTHWESFGLILYFVAAKCNQWMLSLGVAMMIYVTACQWEMAGIGVIGIAIYLVSNALQGMVSWLSQPSPSGSPRAISLRASILGWTAVGLLLTWAITTPFPMRVSSMGIVQSKDRTPIYASTSGRIVDMAPCDAGLEVEPDTMLLTLESGRARSVAIEMKKRWLDATARFERAQRMVYRTPEMQHMLPMLEAQMQAARKQWLSADEEENKLRIAAAEGGWFEPALSSSLEPTMLPGLPMNTIDGAAATGSLRSWCSPASKGRRMEQGTLVGWIHHDREPWVECTVTQEQLSEVRLGTRAKVRLMQSPTEIRYGSVIRVSRSMQSPSEVVPNRMSRDGMGVGASSIGKSTVANGMSAAPMATLYLVMVRLDESDRTPYTPSGGAEVVFHPEQRSMAHLAMDFLMRNLRMR